MSQNIWAQCHFIHNTITVWQYLQYKVTLLLPNLSSYSPAMGSRLVSIPVCLDNSHITFFSHPTDMFSIVISA